MKPPVIRFALAIAGILLPAQIARAQEAHEQPATDPRLTGDWGGARTKLEDAGVTLSAHYWSETAGNPVGGFKQAVRYTQQLDLLVELDLARLAGIDGGEVRIALDDRVGGSLSNDAIGNVFPVQQLYGAGQNLRLSELSYVQRLLDGKVEFQIGWSPLGNSFAGNPYACYFQNNGVCGKPIGIAQDSGGAHNYPVAQWGARLRIAMPKDIYAAAGIYQVNPHLGDKDYGFNLTFQSTGVLMPFEIGWEPNLGSARLPGQYRVGVYYNTSPSPDVLLDVNGQSAGLTGAPFLQRRSRFGFYLMASQKIFVEQPGSKRGLALFASYARGDPHVALFGNSWEIGAVYQGTFRGRDNDYISAVFASGQFNPRLTQYQVDRDIVLPGSVGVQRYERFAEVDYNFQAAPWLSLRPGLQYVLHPGGTGQIPDALVIGLDARITF
ncbi:MAG: carbohydrate porin [Candidatus Sphingomonas colombiensis]|nr:carbohydrate porin [Sphingomonas sp.]WEK44744.1 MAG: carbohydrate porin [Sphingomonas sp.]